MFRYRYNRYQWQLGRQAKSAHTLANEMPERAFVVDVDEVMIMHRVSPALPRQP